MVIIYVLPHWTFFTGMPLLEQLKKSAVDDQQWLTYWVLYSFITLFELQYSNGKNNKLSAQMHISS